MAYKVLIIGCGAIAGGYDANRAPDDWPQTHAGAIARDDRFELIACVDPDDTTREAFAKRWSVPASASSLEALSAEPCAFDVIVIASPTSFHAEHLTWALDQRPKAVFCEKPLAKDLSEAKTIASRYAEANIALAINYSRRWSPTLNGITAEIEAGEYGELINGVGTYTKGIVHNGGHMVDLLRSMIGEVAVDCVGPARFDYWDDDPTVSAVLTAPNGAPIHLVAGDARAVTQFELVLSFTDCQFAMRDGGRRIEFRKRSESDTFAGYREYAPSVSRTADEKYAMWSTYDSIVDMIENGAPPISSAETALAAQAICEEIRLKSLENPKEDTSE